MQLSALTQFISDVATALDAGYDVPLGEVSSHIQPGGSSGYCLVYVAIFS